MLRHVLVGTCLLLPARAYAQSPQFLKLNDTLEIEVHALRRWNAQALNDTLMRISPGLSLASHACAAVLRQTLRFADAEVMQVKETGQPTRYAISVIEPQDSALVRHLAAPSSARPPVERWGTALRIITDEFPAMFALSCRFLRAETDSIGQALASAASLQLRAAIRSHNTTQDLEDAMATLRDDATAFQRITAIWVLTNFPNDARAWGALLSAVRGPRPMGYETWALRSMVAPWGNGSVDLRPHEETLAALASGTALMQIVSTMHLLSEVPLDPAMARRLALAGRAFLLSNLQSRITDRRNAARAFLERASGERYGFDLSAWQRWYGA